MLSSAVIIILFFLLICSSDVYLDRLKVERPEWVASSMSGVTIRSIMSVSTVKVGTTMKSIKPGVKHKARIMKLCQYSYYKKRVLHTRKRNRTKKYQPMNQ